jgi:peptidoglycan/LPS O-acetylase OafA/YrhL
LSGDWGFRGAKFMNTAAPQIPKKNNLEWLRLLFAMQVVVGHASSHMQFPIPEFVGHFPGVPAFFFVSGFLIYASYQNAPGRIYFENRFLRLFPGLMFVTLGGFAVLLVAKGWQDVAAHGATYVVWAFSQITLGQAYNPAHFRDVGVGVINGSLWTLTTEILFYVAVPVIVWAECRCRFVLGVLVVLSYALYVVGPQIWTTAIYRDKTLYSFLELTPLVWGWMFGIGIFAAKYFDQLNRWIRFLPFAVLPLVWMIYSGDGVLWGSSGNRVGLLYFVSYAALILWLAFELPYVRLKLDLSYGVYIWHMPVINLLLVLGMHSMALTVGLTFTMAAISWFFVEKPALRLKRRSIHVVG